MEQNAPKYEQFAAPLKSNGLKKISICHFSISPLTIFWTRSLHIINCSNNRWKFIIIFLIKKYQIHYILSFNLLVHFTPYHQYTTWHSIVFKIFIFKIQRFSFLEYFCNNLQKSIQLKKKYEKIFIYFFLPVFDYSYYLFIRIEIHRLIDIKISAIYELSKFSS